MTRTGQTATTYRVTCRYCHQPITPVNHSVLGASWQNEQGTVRCLGGFVMAHVPEDERTDEPTA